MIEENLELETTGNLGKKITLESIKKDIDKWSMKTITPNNDNKVLTVVFTKEMEDWRFEDYEL